ncbi:MAG: hypothetical protein H6555_02985 [Lewinellaceae bacterium]|nr:hypothetical protein [Lewinellaceae bacterium]
MTDQLPHVDEIHLSTRGMEALQSPNFPNRLILGILPGDKKRRSQMKSWDRCKKVGYYTQMLHLAEGFS